MESSIFSIRASLADAEMFDLFDSDVLSEIFAKVVQSKTFTARVSDDWTPSSLLKLHLQDSDGRDVKDLLLNRLNGRPTPVKTIAVNLRANLKVII
jgi:hypothetical protein